MYAEDNMNTETISYQLITKMVTFINYMLQGKGGSSQLWNAAKLIPLMKPNKKIRPIAINEAWA